MSERLSVKDLEIIGAMTPPTSRAPFNRANLVACGTGGEIVQVHAYTRDGDVEGPTLEEEDWRALTNTNQALALLRPAPLVPGAALWVLRPNLARRDRALHDLRASGVLLHEHLTGDDDAWLCLVDESHPAANQLRDRWRQEALDAARMLGWSGQWPRAETEAELAHAFSRGLDPETLALLILAHERCGRDVRGRGILAMARRSRGEEFARQIGDRLALLRRDLSDPSATARVTTAGATARRRGSIFAMVREVARRGNERALTQAFTAPEVAAA